MTDGEPLRGEARWKAERDAIAARNEAARKRAHEHKGAADIARVEREKRAVVTEAAALRKLNKQSATTRAAQLG